MKRLKDIKEVWAAIEGGRTVYSGNKSYRLTLSEVKADGSNQSVYEYQSKHHTFKNNYVLRVTCTSNWFGGLLEESEIGTLFTDENY